MTKKTTSWHSPRLEREITVCRWGEVGTPVLFFPTAAGDAEECERFLLVDALVPMLEAQQIKLYSVDSTAGMVWLTEDNRSSVATRAQNQFDAAVYHEVVPAIRTDCGADDVEIIVSGASIGAFQAVAGLLRHPDVFSHAICMSGTYDLTKKILKAPLDKDYYCSSPLHFLPDLPEDDQLARTRERFVLITHGKGKWEAPAESWRLADALGARGIPNRVDEWDEEWNHDWPTWRRMMPHYLTELLDLEELPGD